MAYVQADLDNLERMIATGVLKTTYNGNSVEYRSMADLIAARNLVAGVLAQASRVSRSSVTEYARGLGASGSPSFDSNGR